MAGIMELKQVQPQGIHAYGEAGKAHGSCSHHGVHLIAEQAGCQRDADYIVEEGPEQVLVDIGHGAPAQPYSCGHIRKPTVHQDDVGRIDGHIRPGTDGDADICPGQSRCVVDAVSHHGHQAPGFLEFPDHRFFAFRQDASHHSIHPGLPADGFSRPLVVPGDHDHFDPHVLEFFDGLG